MAERKPAGWRPPITRDAITGERRVATQEDVDQLEAIRERFDRMKIAHMGMGMIIEGKR